MALERQTLTDLVNYTKSNTSTYPVQLISIDVHGDDALFLTTAYRKITWNEQEYLNAANILSLSAVDETQDIKASAVNLQLSGISSEIIGALNTTNVIGGIVTVRQGLLNEETGELVGTTDEEKAFLKWSGIINSVSTDEENTEVGDINITVECKSKVGAMLETKNGRFTSDSSFRAKNNDDRSMEFVGSIVDFNPRFGAEE